jgi:hypothetical protein
MKGLFSPKLMSSPTIRSKVRSSGYGKASVAVRELERKFQTKEEKEIEEATFTPDLTKCVQFGGRV